MAEQKEQTLFDIADRRMYSAVKTYHIWKLLNESINIPTVGKEVAEKNVGIINWYGDFFHPLFDSTRTSFIVDLAIFFDPIYKQYEDTFALDKLIATLEQRMSPEEFILLKQEIEKIKRSHGVKISKILTFRNSIAVHQSTKPVDERMSYEEFEQLFAAVQEILNLISKYFNNSYTVWEGMDTEVKNDFERVLANLERGERVRLEEIEKEYQEALKEDARRRRS